MAVVRLGPDGEVEVLVPPAPEEVVEAEAGLLRLAAALGRVAAERDWQDQQRQRRGASSTMSSDRKLNHVISDDVVAAEEARIVAALRAGGYDPSGLDLAPVARAAVARDVIAEVRAAGAHILSAAWGEHGFGGVEIEFEFDSEASWVVGRMALSSE